jgi:hypothetical protein
MLNCTGIIRLFQPLDSCHSDCLVMLQGVLPTVALLKQAIGGFGALGILGAVRTHKEKPTVAR